MVTEGACTGGRKELFLRQIRGLIVEPERVRTEPDFVSSYVSDGRPGSEVAAVVFPRTESEAAALVSMANGLGAALYSPIPEGLAPVKPGVVVDLSLMRRITRIDEENLQAHVEPGVTFDQLQSELDGMNLRVLYPACAAVDSVLLTYLEREILFGATRHSNKQVAVVHCVLADGRLYRSGSHALPNANVSHREDGGPNISKLLFQSKNCFGIPTMGVVNVYPLFEARSVRAWGFERMEDALEAARGIARREYPAECFVANRRKLARELDGADEERLPQWMTAVAIEGGEELVRYYEREAGAIASGGKDLSGSEDLMEAAAAAFESVWFAPPRCLAFYTTYDRIGGFEKIVAERLPGGIAADSLPRLFVPVKRATTFYVHYEFPPDGGAETRDGVRALCLENGAFFNNPSGGFAKQVFEKTGRYYEMLKLWKNHIDPNNIMNADQVL
ncbi:MAG: FAD-binding oxidoreductase [bacterium]